MNSTCLGRTGLMVTRTGFGALPIQRVDFDTARSILRRAYEGGINFFDTARGYSDSEEKIGYALSDVRNDIIIATKSPGKDRAGVLKDVQTSLRNLKTDHVDLLQLHFPRELPDPNDPESSYAGLKEAQARGMAHHIGITNHRLDLAREAVTSGCYETLQFPLSAISSVEDLALIDLCREYGPGLIAMKALSGGLLTNIPAAFAFIRQYENVVPIWGIQRLEELEEFLALDATPPALDAAMQEAIERDRAELAADFCRGCGYCLPCPADIPIPMAARMKLLLRRAPAENFLTEAWHANMMRIKECRNCGQCMERCPYDLDTPRILRSMLEDYEKTYATQKA